MRRWCLLAVAALAAIPAAGGARTPEHRFFIASGVSCELDARASGPGRFASCAIRGGRRASAFLHPTGLARICGGSDCDVVPRKASASMLQVGESLDVGPFECTARSNGVLCIVEQYERGFFIGPAGVRRQEPTGHRDSNPVWSADGRMIVFDRRLDHGRPWQVVAAVNRDGTGVRRLIPGAAHDAAWSPDGSTIAYVDTRRNGAAEVWLRSTDGSGQRQVSGTLISASRPVWSPDGRTFAVRADGAVHVGDAGGHTFRYLEGADEFAWSPNGRQIAVRSGRACGICVVDVADGKRRALFWAEGLRGGIAWSPDGRMIVFSRERAGPASAEGLRIAELYVASADGTGVRRLTHYPGEIGYDSDPIWSPDGRTILFEHANGYQPSDPSRGCGIVCSGFGTGPGYANVELYAMNAEGGNQRRFVSDRRNDLAWSPDGPTIAFAKTGAIWLMDADGSNPRRLT